MNDDNTLTADEAKYFETGGQAELPIEQPATEETTPAQKQEQPKTEEKAEEKKTPPEIEIVEDDDGSEEPDARKYVKVGVLRKEREKAKTFRSELEQTKQQIAALQRQIEQAKNPPREITSEEAPQIALQRVQELENTLAETAAKHNFISSYQRAAAEYAKEQSDFPDAYRHALSVRRSIYETAGYAPEQVNALLESEEAAIVERAFLSGENPAAKFYKIAQTLGYKPAAKEDPKADATDRVVKSAEKLANIAKGMEKNKSVSGGGGADSPPSLAELVEMDDAEFDKATSGGKWKEMMGG